MGERHVDRFERSLVEGTTFDQFANGLTSLGGVFDLLDLLGQAEGAGSHRHGHGAGDGLEVALFDRFADAILIIVDLNDLPTVHGDGCDRDFDVVHFGQFDQFPTAFIRKGGDGKGVATLGVDSSGHRGSVDFGTAGQAEGA